MLTSGPGPTARSVWVTHPPWTAGGRSFIVVRMRSDAPLDQTASSSAVLADAVKFQAAPSLSTTLRRRCMRAMAVVGHLLTRWAGIDLRKSKEHCECQLRIIRTVRWAFQATAQHSSGRLGARNSGRPWQSQLAGHAVRSERRTGCHYLAHWRPRRGRVEGEHETERSVSQPGLSRLSELSF